MPCLVVHDRSDRQADAEVSRRVAALIPDGRLTEIDNTWESPAAIGRFLTSTGLALAAPAAQRGATAGGLTVILFADIADSTALTERLGDAAFRGKARDLDGVLRTIIREAKGTPVEGKLLGDGVLAVFTSARQAIEAALRCGAAGGEAGLPLHLGLHAGDVIEEDGNVFGGAVNIAARVAGESGPGEVLVSGTVRELARTSAGVTFEDAGERALKGISDAVRVWRVKSE
jgi:class 3 adenylate cyclase